MSGVRVRPASLLGAALAVIVGASSFFISRASNPSSGTLAPMVGASASWSGTAPGGASPDGENTCTEGVNCDTYTLTLEGAPADWANTRVRVGINWLAPATDYDLYIHKDSNAGPLVASSAAGTTTSEATTLNPSETGTGVYSVHVVYFAAVAADQYKGAASVIEGPSPPPPSGETPPSFASFQAPPALGNRAGEPTLGVNWFTGNVMFIAGLETLRVTFNDLVSPTQATWVNVPAPNTDKQSFDPILFTDTMTGRTFVSQLLPTKISLSAFTSNDGRTYTISQGAGINSGVDHQTIGGGPFKRCTAAEKVADPVRCAVLASRGPITSYPNAVYYASQDIGAAEAALSRDGGRTYEVAVPMYTLADCAGLHGHIKVARDGTVYVPNKGCTPIVGGTPEGEQAVVVSEDNGLTWQVRRVTGTTRGDNDPSVGIGSGGRIFFGYTAGDKHPRIAVSDDKGRTWKFDQDVGVEFGIKNTVFPAVVAGDNDRASFFFLGTDAEGDGTGDDSSATPFAGTWYGYISTTYDGGKTWKTVRVTDPVQQGVVCTNGTTCPSGTRNLLDFNDVQIDKQGRVVAGYADGCITSQCLAGKDRDGDGRLTKADNDKARKATIVR